jgi:hypothetical protein
MPRVARKGKVASAPAAAPAVQPNVAIPKTLAEQVDELLKMSNEDLAKLDAEKIMALRKNLNPYGRTIQGADKWFTFSITRIADEYWKKFITTAMIGFLHRRVDEWNVPKGVPVVGVYDYLDDKTKLDTPELIIKRDDKSQMYDWEFNRKMMEERVIVKKFLEHTFKFNPDEHVRAAYTPNYGDDSRKILDTMSARIAINRACAKDKKLAAERIEHDAKSGRVTVKKLKRMLKNKRTGEVKSEIVEVREECPPEVTGPTNPELLDQEHPKDLNFKDAVYDNIPSADVFAAFRRYYTENYEDVRTATNTLYCEKPDLEYALNVYDVFDGKDPNNPNAPVGERIASGERAADEFMKKHADEVISSVFKGRTGMWNFFDTFKDQREGVQFYNKNTAVLEAITKQHEQDESIGRAIMERTARAEKRQNVLEHGPDSENFKKWVSENKELEKLGAKHIGDMASEDCPEDAIETTVWRLEKGGTQLTKEKIFSMAVAPDFVEKAHNDIVASGKISAVQKSMPTNEEICREIENM